LRDGGVNLEPRTLVTVLLVSVLGSLAVTLFAIVDLGRRDVA